MCAQETLLLFIEKQTYAKHLGEVSKLAMRPKVVENKTKGVNEAMDFIDYLKIRHTLVSGEKQLKDNSAEQYNNRLLNLKRLKIYNGEPELTEEMEKQIAVHYNDSVKAYPRTIKYYIEYMNYNGQ